MFSNNIKSFIMINIYFLLITNIILLLAIYYQIVKDKIKSKRYEKVLHNLEPKILSFINNAYDISVLKKDLKKSFNKNVTIDIMLDYSEKNDLDINEKFIMLKLDTFLLEKIKKKSGIINIRKLAFMRTENAYDTLLEMILSEDLDIVYTSFFGLSLINISQEKKKVVIRKLISANILSDRIIEILAKFKLSFEDWLELLEKEETIRGKVIFMKNIISREEIKEEKNSDKLLKFLDGEREIKIATILVLCSSKNKKYINKLFMIYESEENWQVRVSIAKGLSNFNIEDVKEVLLKMTKDSEWWVRFNAVKSIVAMGEEGLFTLIDLSLGKEDKKIADLAYYFLNADKDVYNTVNKIKKNIEVKI